MGENTSVGTADEKTLGQNIQSARKLAGLTQQQLCNAAGISYSTLAKIERGAIKTPSVFTVMQIARVLGVSMDSMLGAAVDAGTQIASTTTKKTSKNGVKFLYVDINGCLVRFFHGAFTRLSHETNIPSDVIESTFWHYNDAVCRGDMTMEQFNETIRERLNLDETFDWTPYYLDAVEPIHEMHDLVRWASDHYRVGLLSNIMPGFIDKMIANGTLPNVRYDAIIDSSQVGAIKPEESIYQIAYSKTDVEPEEILLVDDSRTNLVAAERLCWKVLWFDNYTPDESAARIRQALEF